MLVELGRPRRFVPRYLLSSFERSLVFQVNGDSSCPKGVAAHRSSELNSNRSPPNHSVGFRARYGLAGRPFFAKGLEEGLVRLKAGFLQILEQIILRLVVRRHLVVLTAFFQKPKPAPASVFVKITDPTQSDHDEMTKVKIVAAAYKVPNSSGSLLPLEWP